ncbi:MAG: serine/threonine protein kinase [Polyangiaceae bacterium]|nr:serine/threonine protein kinase [Polyangiaceae bacterium]
MPAKGPEFQPGTVMPGTKYTVVKRLGAGGMGIVYQVIKPPAIQCVLKLMSSEISPHPSFREKFLDEARILAQLEHPNIVRVFDYDKLADGTPFYVMELLHGQTVRDVLEAKRIDPTAKKKYIPPRAAFEITRQLLEALHCAHTHNVAVIHRDIKPENIFLHMPKHGEPTVKLIDFGVVMLSDKRPDGVFAGTLGYAAPEQIRGLRVTPATDLYAVGLVLYEILTGFNPFNAYDNLERVQLAQLLEVPPPVSNYAPWVPDSIVSLIAEALAKDPAARPRDAYTFAQKLRDLETADDGDGAALPGVGPLTSVLSTVGAAAVSSQEVPADHHSPPSDQSLRASDCLSNLPLLGVPDSRRYHGSTLRGLGKKGSNANRANANGANATAVPGDDTLLGGLEAGGTEVLDPALAPLSAKPVKPINVAETLAEHPSNGASGKRNSIDASEAVARAAVSPALHSSKPPRRSSRPPPLNKAKAKANGKRVAREGDTLATHSSDLLLLGKQRARRRILALVAATVLLLAAGGGFAVIHRMHSNAEAGASQASQAKPNAPASAAAHLAAVPSGSAGAATTTLAPSANANTNQAVVVGAPTENANANQAGAAGSLPAPPTPESPQTRRTQQQQQRGRGGRPPHSESGQGAHHVVAPTTSAPTKSETEFIRSF